MLTSFEYCSLLQRHLELFSLCKYSFQGGKCPYPLIPQSDEGKQQLLKCFCHKANQNSKWMNVAGRNFYFIFIFCVNFKYDCLICPNFSCSVSRISRCLQIIATKSLAHRDLNECRHAENRILECISPCITSKKGLRHCIMTAHRGIEQSKMTRNNFTLRTITMTMSVMPFML